MLLISTPAEILHQRRALNPDEAGPDPRIGGYWKSRGAQRGERCILGVRMEAVRCDAGVKKGGELSVHDSRTEGIAPCEILLQCKLLDFV